MAFIHCECSFCGEKLIRNKQSKIANVRLHFCDLKCKAEYQKLAKPVTKEWLFDQYVVKEKDCCQIAIIVNRDPKSVWNWLKDFNIPTRKRGSYWNKFFTLRGRNPGFRQTEETKRKIREARLRDGHVPYLRNGVHWLKGKRGPEVPNWKGGSTPERQAFYSSLEWKAVARKVWKRDKRICQRCGRKKERGLSFDIHHIVSFLCKKLRCVPSNLVLLCEPCHYWVHGKHNKKGLFLKAMP